MKHNELNEGVCVHAKQVTYRYSKVHNRSEMVLALYQYVYDIRQKNNKKVFVNENDELGGYYIARNSFASILYLFPKRMLQDVETKQDEYGLIAIVEEKEATDIAQKHNINDDTQTEGALCHLPTIIYQHIGEDKALASPHYVLGELDGQMFYLIPDKLFGENFITLKAPDSDEDMQVDLTKFNISPKKTKAIK